MRNTPLPETPKEKQIWRTHLGHRVRIITTYMPGPPRCIEALYVQDHGATEKRVNGKLGINFDLDGNAVMSEDWLVERES